MSIKARVLRYEVPVDDQWHDIDLPVGSRIVHVAARQPEIVEFWAEVPAGEVTDRRTFRAFGAGQSYDLHQHQHRGTTLTAGGRLVWHLIETRHA